MSRLTTFHALASPLFNLCPRPCCKSISSVCNSQLGCRWCLACHHLLAHLLPLPPEAPVLVPTPALLASLHLHFQDDSLWFQGDFTGIPYFPWPWPPSTPQAHPWRPFPWSSGHPRKFVGHVWSERSLSGAPPFPPGLLLSPQSMQSGSLGCF